MKIENATIILHGGPIRMSHEELNAGAISNCQLFAAARRPLEAGDKAAIERLDREATERVARHDSGEG